MISYLSRLQKNGPSSSGGQWTGDEHLSHQTETHQIVYLRNIQMHCEWCSFLKLENFVTV